MIWDRELIVSDAQAITVTANSTDVIDLITTADIARGYPLRFRLQVDTTFTAGGAATLTTQLVTSAASNLGSPTELYNTGAVAVATLVAGYIIIDRVIPATALRYLGLIFTVATGPMLTGAVTGGILTDTETPMAARIIGNTAAT